MTSTERFAYETEIKQLKARNNYLASACGEFLGKERNHLELISILRNENHNLQERILDLETCR